VETSEFKEAIIKYENARKESTEAYEILAGKFFPQGGRACRKAVLSRNET
jgi:hypothetical protein